MNTSMGKYKLEIVGVAWDTLKGISHKHSVKIKHFIVQTNAHKL